MIIGRPTAEFWRRKLNVGEREENRMCKAWPSFFSTVFKFDFNSFLTKSLSVVQICTRAVHLVSIKIVGSGCLTWRTFWKERFLCMNLLFISWKMTKYCQKYCFFFSSSFEHAPNFVKDLYGRQGKYARSWAFV